MYLGVKGKGCSLRSHSEGHCCYSLGLRFWILLALAQQYVLVMDVKEGEFRVVCFQVFCCFQPCSLEYPNCAVTAAVNSTARVFRCRGLLATEHCCQWMLYVYDREVFCVEY